MRCSAPAPPFVRTLRSFDEKRRVKVKIGSVPAFRCRDESPRMATMCGTLTADVVSPFPSDEEKLKPLGDDPAFGFTVEEIGYVSYPGTDCTIMKEILRVTEKLGVQKDPNVILLWKQNLRELVLEILKEKPKSWENCELIPPRDFIRLMFVQNARSKPHSSITGFQNVLESAGFSWPQNNGFNYDKQGLLRFLDFGSEEEKKGKWNAVVDHVMDVHAWMIQSDAAQVPGHGMLIRVFGKHEPYSVKKLAEGKHRSIQMPDLSVSIIEHYYSSWLEPVQGGYVLRTLDDLMKLWPCGRDVNWMLGGDIFKTIQMAKNLPLGVPLYSLDVSGWDRSMDFSVIEELYLSTVRQTSVARSLAYGINGRGIYKVSDLLFRFKDERCVLWASGNNKTLSGNCIMHAALLRTLGLSGFVQGDDGVCFFKGEQGDLSASYLSAGLTTKYVTPDVGSFEFTKRRYNLNARTVTVTGDLFKKMLAETDENAGRSAAGVSATLRSFHSEASNAGWNLLIEKDDPVVEKMLNMGIIVLPT